jgi:peptidoglycan/LPS O-acetylase OafA/YrhL
MPGRLGWLDLLRVLCAVSVVMFHYTVRGPLDRVITSNHSIPYVNAVAKYGYLGVDAFFIISGFVIYNSAQARGVATFAQGRLVRLYPTFLASMLISYTIQNLLGAGLSWKQLLANMTMASRLFGQPAVDGVYWSLLLEIGFYFGIGFLIWIKKLPFLEWLSVLIVVATSISLAAGIRLGLLGYVPLFGVGCIFASIRTQGWNRPRVLWIVLGGFVASVGAAQRAAASDVPLSVAVAGIVMACVVLVFALCLNRNLDFKHAATFGALTYPLYLLHQEMGYQLLARIESPLLGILATITVMVGLSYFLVAIERRYNGRIKEVVSVMFASRLFKTGFEKTKNSGV